MLATLLWAAASAALCALALFVHTRVRACLPEDPPGPARKRHPRPMPMAGAIPAALATAVLWAFGLPAAAGATALAGAVGLADDVKKERGTGVRWTTKAIVLAAAAGLGVGALPGIDALGWPSIAAAVVALFVITNATNFLDNQDGVATVLGVVALLLAGGGDPTALGTVLAGVWLAFLPFNWPRARAFLGDGGALALGTCAGMLALRGAVRGDSIEAFTALAPVAVLVFDFVQVVLARLILGYAPWIADRRHVTHVLLARGVPRVALAPLLATLALALGLLLLPR